ncbi:MAG: phosphoribosylformylglycinamidine cyclo-ligase [candidate division Zixibacteria bacterium]|nr:phosphoribosylformylglycinamidine cyclo-ligase [candidate division Zixibacteria bacterium]
MSENNPKSKLTYAASGVDVKAGEESVEKIKSLVAETFNPQVLTGIGAFGGFFKPDMKGIEKPVFISSADGVGTKLKLAFMTDLHDTVGEDLVNHCVNDILVHGAKALFFLDYIATGKLSTEVVAGIVTGLSRGCKNSGMALLGGETAEMPDFYQIGEYDLAGFIVGVVDENRIINGSTIVEGDVCLGLKSNGLHTNGYSLARKVAFEIGGLKPDDKIEELGETIAQSLMKVHRCYANLIHPVLDNFSIHGMAHITGGGIPGNLKRILPEGLSAEIKKGTWDILPIFDYLKKIGNIDPDDIYSAFNMGIGYILVVPKQEAENVIKHLNQAGEDVFTIGKIIKGDKTVRMVD